MSQRVYGDMFGSSHGCEPLLRAALVHAEIRWFGVVLHHHPHELSDGRRLLAILTPNQCYDGAMVVRSRALRLPRLRVSDALNMSMPEEVASIGLVLAADLVIPSGAAHCSLLYSGG